VPQSASSCRVVEVDLYAAAHQQHLSELTASCGVTLSTAATDATPSRSLAATRTPRLISGGTRSVSVKSLAVTNMYANKTVTASFNTNPLTPTASSHATVRASITTTRNVFASKSAAPTLSWSQALSIDTITVKFQTTTRYADSTAARTPTMQQTVSPNLSLNCGSSTFTSKVPLLASVEDFSPLSTSEAARPVASCGQFRRCRKWRGAHPQLPACPSILWGRGHVTLLPPCRGAPRDRRGRGRGESTRSEASRQRGPGRKQIKASQTCSLRIIILLLFSPFSSREEKGENTKKVPYTHFVLLQANLVIR
jgi:hypothetical protein